MNFNLFRRSGQVEILMAGGIVVLLALATFTLGSFTRSREEQDLALVFSLESFYAQEIAALNAYQLALATGNRTPGTSPLVLPNQMDPQSLAVTPFSALNYTPGTPLPLAVTKQFDPGNVIMRRYSPTNLTREVSLGGGAVRYCGNFDLGKAGVTQTCIAEPAGCSTAATGFAGGTGTPADPYQICNIAQLNNVRNHLSRSFILTADITFGASDSIAPLTSSQFNPFRGSFNGDNHSIANWTYSSTGAAISLFGYVNTTGSIRNTLMTNVNVQGATMVAGLVSQFTGGGSISGCRVTGTVRATNSNAAGIVSSVNGGVLSNLSAAVNVTTARGASGGIVGSLQVGSLSDSFSTGNVTGALSNTEYYVGGLAGLATGNVTNCYATGNVTGGEYVGGLLGGCGTGFTVSNSYATGNVAGVSNAGGLIGNCTCAATRVYASGNVSASAAGFNVFGGLVGWNNHGNISQAYATGSVNGAGIVGGLVGRNQYGFISDSYASGAVTGTTQAGGFIGSHNAVIVADLSLYANSLVRSYSRGQVNGPTTGVVAHFIGGLTSGNRGAGAGFYQGNSPAATADCFWNTQTSTRSYSGHGSGKTTAEMLLASTFLNAGWSPAIWNLTNGAYPTLR